MKNDCMHADSVHWKGCKNSSSCCWDRSLRATIWKLKWISKSLNLSNEHYNGNCYYFENDCCRNVLSSHTSIHNLGQLYMTCTKLLFSVPETNIFHLDRVSKVGRKWSTKLKALGFKNSLFCLQWNSSFQASFGTYPVEQKNCVRGWSHAGHCAVFLFNRVHFTNSDTMTSSILQSEMPALLYNAMIIL